MTQSQTPLTLRWYQTQAIQAIYDYFASGNKGNPVLSIPTGGGKSLIVADFLRGVFTHWPNQKVLILTHVKELIAQNYKELMGLWPNAPAGIYSAGLNKRQSHCPITFAGIASVVNQAQLFGHVDLVIIDEVHLVSPKDETRYQKFLNALHEINPHLKCIGLTATPWRLGQGYITEDGIFTDIIYDISRGDQFLRLISEGYLAPMISKPMLTEFDLDGVNIRGGEFVQNELQIAVDREEITRQALRETMLYGQDRRAWLIFGTGIEHCQHICDMLNKEFDIPATLVHSKMPSKVRDANIADYKAGKYRAIISNGVLTTGFNHPPIDLIVMLRPTGSSSLWVQMLGRGARTFPGKSNCLVLDFARNTVRLGPINDPIIPNQKGNGTGEAPVKECPQCRIYVPASVRICPYCSYEFPIIPKIVSTASSQDIIKGEFPKIEIIPIDHVTYHRHNKLGKPPSMLVTYYHKLSTFKEFICLEHQGMAQHKARSWWRARNDDPVPLSIDEALVRSADLPIPSHIKVWTNRHPFPEILAHDFTFTAFGTVDKELEVLDTQMYENKGNPLIDLDDIPF